MLLKRAWPILLLSAACTTSAEPDGGVDAALDGGVDAGPRDAGRDARPVPDGGPDAGRDGGPRDAMWVPLARLPDGCTIERALRPEVLFTPRWEPCAEQPEGCLREIRGLGPARGYTDTGWFDGERGYFEVVGGGAHSMIAVTDGSAVAAWKVPNQRDLLERNIACSVRLGLGDGYAAVLAHYFNGDDPSRNVDWVFHAPIDEIGSVTEPIAVMSGPILAAGSAQRMAVSSELIGMWFGAGIWLVTSAGRQGGVLTAESGIPQNISVVGSHALWEDWGSRVRVAHGSIDEPATIFRRADPGDIKAFRTDGVELTWLEGYDRQPDGHYARLELWAAPYVRDPADLEPRFVRSMEVRSAANYGGGWYVMRRERPAHYEVVDTSDGSLREWTPTGAGIAAGPPPLYVSDREILFNYGGLVRIDPHTLPIVE